MEGKESSLVTILFGGDWKNEGWKWEFGGIKETKAIIVHNRVTYEGIREKIVERFKVDENVVKLGLSYSPNGMKNLQPFDIKDEDDWRSYVFLNIEAKEVVWPTPICVVAKRIKDVQQCQSHPSITAKAAPIIHGSVNNVVMDEEERKTIINLGSDNEEEMDDEGSLEGIPIVIEDVDADDVVADVDDVDADDVDVDDVDDPKDEEEDVVEVARPLSSTSSLFSTMQMDKSITVGAIFSSKEELQLELHKMALRENFEFLVKKSNPMLLVVFCKAGGCNWRLRAARFVASKVFMIRKISGPHSCLRTLRANTHHQATAFVIGEHMKNRFEGSSQAPNPKQIQTLMRTEFGVKASYHKCWKAGSCIQEIAHGTPEQSYERLHEYFYMLERENPHTYTYIEKDSFGRFKYAFLAFGASLAALSWIRKVISVDGTFLKGKYRGTLLVATAQDGNLQIYPLAFAVVDGENDASWDFFFRHLKHVVPDTVDLVFVSDRHQSIAKAVHKTYVFAKHGHCMWHMKQNILTRYRSSDVGELFVRAAKSYRHREFNDLMLEMEAMRPGIMSYLKDAQLDKWARCHFPANRYNIMTTNNSESINSLLNKERGFPLIGLFEHIRETLTRWFFERRDEAKKLHDDEVTPSIHKVLEEKIKMATHLYVRPLNGNEFQVSGGNTNVVVNLQDLKCSCKEFDIDHYPCNHAIAAARHRNVDLESLVNNFFKVHALGSLYGWTIYPVPAKELWSLPADRAHLKCMPPQVRAKPGRPRTRRYVSVGEFKRKVKCSNCDRYGHYRRTCVLPSKSGTN